MSKKTQINLGREGFIEQICIENGHSGFTGIVDYYDHNQQIVQSQIVVENKVLHSSNGQDRFPKV